MKAHLALSSSLLLLASGCASLGGNVKGSFSCAAPDGICAPSSSIDDRALAMISGEGSEPIGPATRPSSPSRGVTPSQSLSDRGDRETPESGAERTRERVLRIVFPAHVDDRGRLHEASALHVVAGRSEWRSAAIRAATPLSRPVGAPQGITPPADMPGAAHSDAGIVKAFPSPEAVRRARAQNLSRTDPVASIRAEVDARLASQPGAAKQPASRELSEDKDGVAKQGGSPAPAKPSIPSADDPHTSDQPAVVRRDPFPAAAAEEM